MYSIFNVDKLKKSTRDRLNFEIRFLSHSAVKEIGSTYNTMACNRSNENGMRSTESTVCTSDNNSPGNLTKTIPLKTAKKFGKHT